MKCVICGRLLVRQPKEHVDLSGSKNALASIVRRGQVESCCFVVVPAQCPHSVNFPVRFYFVHCELLEQ